MQPLSFFRAPRRANLALFGALIGASVSTQLGCGSKDSFTDNTDMVEGDDDDGDSADAGTGKRDAGKDTGVPEQNVKPDGSRPPVKPDDGQDKCAGIRNDAPPAAGVDVIFLIDTSGSMLHAITQVQANIAKFVQDFEGSPADTRVIMITGADPAAGSPVAMQADKYRFIPSEVDSGALFAVALAAFPLYQDFLRPTSAVQLIMVTDDNDRLAPPMFKQQMQALLGGRTFTQHAIASEDVNGLPCISEAQLWNPLCVAPIPAVCAAAAIGKTYSELAKDTGGQELSICKADWSGLFSSLRDAVLAAVPLPCSFPLSSASTMDFDSAKVKAVYTPPSGGDEEFPRADSADQCGDKVGWYYDDLNNPTTVILCPSACEDVAAGGSIDIEFGCIPQVFI